MSWVIYDFSYISFVCCGLPKGEIVRTYVIHLLWTYVTILCNWLILWQNALYLYLGRSRMCLILQETSSQDQVLKPCKSIQDQVWKMSVIKARQLAIYRAWRVVLASWLDSSSTDSYLSRFKKNIFFCSVFFQFGIMCLSFLFSQP